jgi:hypothetical protein
LVECLFQIKFSWSCSTYTCLFLQFSWLLLLVPSGWKKSFVESRIKYLHNSWTQISLHFLATRQVTLWLPYRNRNASPLP